MNVPKLRFKGFNEKWKVKKLREISELITKGTTPKYFSNQGINFIKIECFDGDRINKDKCLFIDENAHNKELKRSILFEGDILFAIAGATIGKCNIVTNDILPANTNQALSIIRLRKNENKEFIYHILSSNFMQKYIVDNISVGAQPNLNLEQMGNFLFPYPSLPEQTKIANFLTAIDEKITQLTQKCDLLAQYKKGVMQQIFSQKLRFKDEDGREFPEWREKILGDVTEIIMGQSPDSNSYNDLAKGKPLIQGNADIANRKTNPRAWTTAPTKECKVNDIILTVRAPVGAVAISYHEACIGRGVCAIRNNKETISSYIYQLLLWFEPTKWISLEQGSTFTAVSSKDIKTIDIPFPAIAEQTKIANFLTAVDDKITHTQTQLEAVKLYKKGLLQQMFV